ncbi:UNVERIFIED_CONTAM: hypothetical protein NY100_03135 [Prevotella sp. 15_C9]
MPNRGSLSQVLVWGRPMAAFCCATLCCPGGFWQWGRVVSRWKYLYIHQVSFSSSNCL